MPYPVQPNEPPAIVHTLITEDTTPDWVKNSVAAIAENQPVEAKTLDDLPAELSNAESTSSAELLGPAVETNLSNQSHQEVDFYSEDTVIIGFTNPENSSVNTEIETQNRENTDNFSFTTYHLIPSSEKLAQGTPEALPTEIPSNLEPERSLPEESPESPSIEIPSPEEIPAPKKSPESQQTPLQPKPQTSPKPETPTTPKPPDLETLEIKADRQEFDEKQQIVTATGKVIVRFRQSAIDADKAVVNLVTQQMVAEGNVAYRRGQQLVRGDRMEYNLGLETGAIAQAKGELFLPTASEELTPNLPTDISAGVLDEPLSDRILSQQPLRGVRANPGANIIIGGRRGQFLTFPQIVGTVNRVRFEADKLDIQPDGSRIATNIRISNDPFSPPEFELRARRAIIRQISPTAQELVTTSPRMVFDQTLKIPIYPQRFVFDSSNSNGPCLTFGFDGGDRGGLYTECAFNVFSKGPVQLTVVPQFYIQRAIKEHEGNPFFPDNYGMRLGLSAKLAPRTRLQGSAQILNFDRFPNVGEKNFRGNLRLRQHIGDHTLTAEYSYRDRLFNGTLGYQTVHSSVGVLFASPIIPIGNTDINLSYQVGYQFINADSDRPDLLPLIRPNNRVDLNRFQASFAASRGFNLWRGKPLPRTQTQGLKYTARPVVPFVQLALGIRGVTSIYSNGDSQNSLAGSIGIQGQFGHFSRNYLDYTAFNITYTQVARDGVSPFLFDRLVDLRILSMGIVQQVFGGLRVGIQSAVNLQSGEVISTDYTLEYSHRTYGIILRFNPQRQIGSFIFRISDFNWLGNPKPFSGVGTVDGGVRLSD
ncbi:OstA family protein [Oscillatoriales cyanobacterium USR001]|nr:OstA family protein [Oscillatoriales cyanobacterium USR001]